MIQIINRHPSDFILKIKLAESISLRLATFLLCLTPALDSRHLFIPDWTGSKEKYW
jgi:hypothetical protein